MAKKTTSESTIPSKKEEDIFLRYSALFLRWLEKNILAVSSAFGVMILVGLAWTGYQHYCNSVELEAQAEMFKIEKQFLKVQADVAKSNKKDRPDLDKTYGKYIQSLTQFIDKNKKTDAAAIASLHLGKLYYEYGKYQPGLELLEKIKTRNELLKGLVLVQKGVFHESLGDCNKANEQWTKVIKERTLAHLHPESMLKQAVCLQSLSKKKEAKSVYQKLITEHADTEPGKKAKGYLRLLQVKGS